LLHISILILILAYFYYWLSKCIVFILLLFLR
jgi:hypothetical protein